MGGYGGSDCNVVAMDAMSSLAESRKKENMYVTVAGNLTEIYPETTSI